VSKRGRLDWLAALEVPLGGAAGVVLVPVTHPAHPPAPALPEGVRRIEVPLTSDELAAFVAPTGLAGAGTARWVVVPPAVPRRTRDLELAPPGAPELSGEAAAVAALLDSLPEGAVAALFVTRRLLVGEASAPFRGWLDGRYRVSWVLHLGPAAAEAVGTPGLEMAVVVVESGDGDEEMRLTRLADLRSLAPAEWQRVLRGAARREGGEVESSIVVRGERLGAEPWTYERFSGSFQRAREDATVLGESMPLGELAEVLEGIGPKDLTAFVRESRAGAAEPTVAAYGRRSLGSGGELGRPAHMLAEHLVPSAARLAAADLLVGARPEAREGALAVVEIAGEALPATFETGVLAVRFREGASPQVRELVAGYLGSEHAVAWLRARGALPRIGREHLEALGVPRPRAEVFQALEELAAIERTYLGWAAEARSARSELFARSSFADTVPRLLELQRLERERVRAGADSRGLDYQIRNYYPHPIAARRESVQQARPGEASVRDTLDCAEIAITVLSLVGYAQLRALGICRDDEFPGHLAQYAQGGSFSFDWGKHRSFLDHAIAASARHENPLALPLPELATLGLDGAWSDAERALREERNRLAHLLRVRPSEQRRLGDELREALDRLLAGLALLSTARLAVVDDYSLDAVSGARVAELRLLRGASRLFARQTLRVDRELARGGVGLLDGDDRLHGLSPWLLWTHCPRCEHDELFGFARCDGGMAHYVALGTGHPLESEPLGRRWEEMIERGAAAP
jgi:hypothetical protein